MTFVYFKGATAFECQIGVIYGKWIHLRGSYWYWKPWRRISFGIDRTAREDAAAHQRDLREDI